MGICGRSFSSKQDPAKQSKVLFLATLGIIKLNTPKSGVCCASRNRTKAQEAVPITGTGHFLGIKDCKFLVLTWIAQTKSQATSVSGRKCGQHSSLAVSTQRSCFFQALKNWWGDWDIQSCLSAFYSSPGWAEGTRANIVFWI
jgi:hypothetical protein